MVTINDTLGVPREAPKGRSFAMPFWNATREKKLLLQYDPHSRLYQFFPRAAGLVSGRRDLEWRESPGRGEVFSYTVAYRAREPFRGHEPFLIALVTLDEGVNVMANMVNCDLATMTIGLRVKPYWHPLPGGMHLLMFEPDR